MVMVAVPSGSPTQPGDGVAQGGGVRILLRVEAAVAQASLAERQLVLRQHQRGRDLAPSAQTADRLSRAFREGEAESKNPALTNIAMAKWTDATRRYLTCPRCGITELAEQA